MSDMKPVTIQITLDESELKMLGFEEKPEKETIANAIHNALSSYGANPIEIVNAEYDKTLFGFIKLTFRDGTNRYVEAYVASLIGQASDDYYYECDVITTLENKIEKGELDKSILDDKQLVAALVSDYASDRRNSDTGGDECAMKHHSVCMDDTLDLHMREIEKYAMKKD